MTVRRALAALVGLAALAPTGCQRPRSTAPAATAAAPAGRDYRTLDKAQLEALIRSQTGQEVALTSGGPNRYTGTITAPGGTALPVVVTVEAERIVCETKVGDSSTRQIITPRGLQSDLNMK
jgi:hypothetical protein